MSLSREHHHVLLHARELKWAARGKGDGGRVVSAFHSFWDSDAEAHFRLEEDRLLPWCENHLPGLLSGEIKTILEHHEAIRRIVRQLRDTGDLPEIMMRAAFLLDDHVRFEERIFFEKLQHLLNEKEMEGLGLVLTKQRSGGNCDEAHGA